MAPHSSSDILNGFEKTSDNANSFILRKGVNNIFIYYAGRAENEAILWFLLWVFLCSQLLQLFRRMLQSCRKVSWSTKLHLSLHPTEGVQIKTESSLLWELIFNILHLNIDLSRSNHRD